MRNQKPTASRQQATGCRRPRNAVRLELDAGPACRRRRIAVNLLAAACCLAAVGCQARGSAPAAKRKSNVDYSAIVKQSEGFLDRVERHANALADLGPRQTGQAGCDQALAYVRRVLAEAAPTCEPTEISTTVSVPMDRRGADELAAVEGHSHVVVERPGQAASALPAYALMPNSVQACRTHPAEACPLGGCVNCEKPRKLVDLRGGEWDDLRGKDLCDTVVLLDFNSGDAWLRAVSMGAYGAVFAEPEPVGSQGWAGPPTTVFQADLKYLATLPLHVPRLYVRKEQARELRAAMAADPNGVRVQMASRLAWRNVTARGLELTIPGKNRSYCYVLAGHFDARSIVPDLSYGAAEVWGLAELLELVRYFADPARQPACDLKFMFVSGHWQNQQLMRDRLAPDGPEIGKVGSYYKLAMGVDLEPVADRRPAAAAATQASPAADAGGDPQRDLITLNILSESAWDVNSYRSYNWFRTKFFPQDGWREQILKGLGFLRPAGEGGGRQEATEGSVIEVFAGQRPNMSETRDDVMADRNNRSPLIFAPRYPTAEEPWQSFNMPTFAFQTGRLARLTHNTPMDRKVPGRGPWAAGATGDAFVKDQLRPQVQFMLATMEHLLEYPENMLPNSTPLPRKPRGWSGYARISGRILEWDKSIGWFSQRLPGQEPGPGNGTSGPASHPGNSSSQPAIGHPQSCQTFVQALPADMTVNNAVSPLADKRVRTFRPWVNIPGLSQHRQLQSFAFQDLRLLDRPGFRINTIYTSQPTTEYVVAAYTIDAAGRICYATDFGVHGDGNKAFQCTEVPLENWDVNVPVSLFECGSVELFDLTDIQRYSPGWDPTGSFLFGSAWGYAETGIPPFLRIQGIKDIRSHTEIERWGFTQYGSTAMVFLPGATGPGATGVPPVGAVVPKPTGKTPVAPGAEILLGGHFTNFAVLNNPDEHGRPRGYSLSRGQALRLADCRNPTPAQCVKQLAALDTARIQEFAKYDVASPLAGRYHQDSAAAIAAADKARQEGDYQTARAHDMRSWVLESGTYRTALALLMDVVSTTVLYFVLLIPFSFLIERLVFPQRTVLWTVLVAAAVFAVFAGLLYIFHPGFKLAHNILVITISFVIVIMSLPALILLLVRGVAMLRAIGSKAVITQRSEAEAAGVVTASLSLAVSNMRRRRLRTALTLSTITILVMALVLLTTSSAFDFRLLEPSPMGTPSFEGIQIYNTQDRRKSLLPEMVEVYERLLNAGGVAPVDAVAPQPPTLVRREFVNYGYDHKSENACLFLVAGGYRERLPYFQIMGAGDDQIEYVAPKSLASDPRFAAKRNVGREASGVPGATGVPPVASATAPTGGTPVAPSPKTIRLSDLVEGRFFRPGDVNVCLLPSAIAQKLHIKVGDTVRVMGLGLEVVGIWTSEIDDKATGAQLPGPWDELVDLDGLPITALRQSASRQGQPDNPVHAPSSETVIVPRAWIDLYRILPTTIESLIVVPPRGPDGRLQSAPILEQAQQLAREILNVDVFSHFKDPQTGQGVAQRLSMRTSTQIKGSSMMLIVLVVAVLMILAIMTGTVYERMKEIHIFSSVGLSPRHIAGMFFVEALVFAGIAAVLGYFLGVIALKVLLGHLKATGQAVDFYPNYLGVFVLYSIGIAVLATLASSLYPIRLASRIVNPSAGKTWKFADGDSGDHVSILLPFIATTWDEVKGMMVYAYDYLAIHQGERSGRFVCEKPPAGGVQGRVLWLEMPIWLAPFERNLSQQTVLVARPTADGIWWELTLELHRLSGQEYLWKRGATVFVNLLCKHLLRWRAVSAAQEAESARRGDGVFLAAEGGQST